MLKTRSTQTGKGDCLYLEVQAPCVMGMERSLTTYLLLQPPPNSDPKQLTSHMALHGMDDNVNVD